MTDFEPMTREPMTRDELLELAALDAFGLLDQYEAALYTRSFHHAPAAVQDEVLDLQSALASEDTMLPSDLPSAELRDKVIQAVARAVEKGDGELAPLATIGTGRVTAARNDSFAHAAMSPPPPTRSRLSASGQLWRAAAFALAATTFAALYFGMNERSLNSSMVATIIAADTHEEYKKAIGVDFFNQFLGDRNNQRIVLNPVDTDAGIVCMVYVNITNDNDGAHCDLGFRADHLPKSQDYTITARDAEGRTHIDKRFTNRTTVAGVALGEIAPQLLASLTWELKDASGAVIASNA